MNDHVTYKWVTSIRQESCHVWMSDVKHEHTYIHMYVFTHMYIHMCAHPHLQPSHKPILPRTCAYVNIFKHTYTHTHTNTQTHTHPTTQHQCVFTHFIKNQFFWLYICICIHVNVGLPNVYVHETQSVYTKYKKKFEENLICTHVHMTICGFAQFCA